MDGALAQGTRIIKGIVLDSANHKPVSQAAVYVGRRATGQRTGNDGTFRVSADEGPQLLVVRRTGLIPALVPVPGGPAGTETDVGTTNLREIKTDADRAAARETDVKAYPELGQFYDHMARYRQGVFLTPDGMQRVHGTLLAFIREKPGFQFICFANRKGEVDCGQEFHRGPTSVMSGTVPPSAERPPCPLEVWKDGPGPQTTLDEVLVDEILAVEAYPNPGLAPPEFAGSPCASIMLWMRKTDQ